MDPFSLALIASSSIVAFAAGWILRGRRRRNELTTIANEWQRQVELLEARIALDRLTRERDDDALRVASGDTAPVFELRHEPQLARPRARTSDSPPARA